MGEGMVTDLMPFGDLPLQQVLMLFGGKTDYKEGRRRVFLPQDIQNRGRGRGIRPVVKSQRQLVIGSAVSGNDVRRRKIGYLFRRDDRPVGIESDVAFSFLGPVSDIEDLAPSLVVQVISVAHHPQLSSRALIHRAHSAVKGPDRRVFAP